MSGVAKERSDRLCLVLRESIEGHVCNPKEQTLIKPNVFYFLVTIFN
ncbi:MAG: hypothetical protein AAGF83_24450 [Cyanobacteria bacterium P01_G01_bin.67]